jgi:REP element-mobilizing transposase RayT
MNDVYHMLITWTNYGTWLPGNERGWRKRNIGVQIPRPLLEQWCRAQLKGDAVLLSPPDRTTVEDACREHSTYRGWMLHAVNARTNHVHVVVSADLDPAKVRDQLKANCTRRLRMQENPLDVARTWSRGGDCELLNEVEIEFAVSYVMEAQDRKGVEDRDIQ